MFDPQRKFPPLIDAQRKSHIKNDRTKIKVNVLAAVTRVDKLARSKTRQLRGNGTADKQQTARNAGKVK